MKPPAPRTAAGLERSLIRTNVDTHQSPPIVSPPPRTECEGPPASGAVLVPLPPTPTRRGAADGEVVPGVVNASQTRFSVPNTQSAQSEPAHSICPRCHKSVYGVRAAAAHGLRLEETSIPDAAQAPPTADAPELMAGEMPPATTINFVGNLMAPTPPHRCATERTFSVSKFRLRPTTMSSAVPRLHRTAQRRLSEDNVAAEVVDRSQHVVSML